MTGVILTALGVSAAAAGLGGLALARRGANAKQAAEELAPALGERLDVAAKVEGRDVRAKLHYITRGAADAQPIVLIHGMGGSTYHFTSTIMDDLAKDHYVVAFDRPGCGYSENLNGRALDLFEQAALLREGVRALGVERPILVGHSLGGGVAAAYALDAPQDVAGLALIAAPVKPFTSKPPFQDKSIESAWMRGAFAWTLGVSAVQRGREITLAAIFHPQAAPQDYETAGGGALAARPGQVAANLADLAMLQPSLGALSERLGDLKAPCVAMYGQEDAVFHPTEQAKFLKEAAPHTRLVQFSGIGHMIQFIAPDRVAAAIRSVLG